MNAPAQEHQPSQSISRTSPRGRLSARDVRDTAENGTLLLAAESASQAAEAAARSLGEEVFLGDSEQLLGLGPVFWTIALRIGMFMLLKLLAAWLKDHNSYGWLYQWLSQYLTWRRPSDPKPGGDRIFPWRRRK
jgi:hypothetical protein